MALHWRAWQDVKAYAVTCSSKNEYIHFTLGCIYDRGEKQTKMGFLLVYLFSVVKGEKGVCFFPHKVSLCDFFGV